MSILLKLPKIPFSARHMYYFLIFFDYVNLNFYKYYKYIG